MKDTLRIITVAILAVLATLPMHAQVARSCSLLTLKGSYAFTVHGQILTGAGAGIVDGIALTTFEDWET